MFPDESTDNARLAPMSGGEGVTFQFNPAAIALSHTAPMQPSAARKSNRDHSTSGDTSPRTTYVQGGQEEIAKANGITNISMRGVTFAGPAVADTCMRLLEWTGFRNVDQSSKKQDLPELRFTWGPLNFPVNLNQVTINYTRFSRTGTPVRALVDLTLHLIPKDMQPTNPTSGGVAGRRTHLLTGAETLPELATRVYGGPGHWRQIAAANGIADPLRVRPGTLVYLPSAEEDGR